MTPFPSYADFISGGPLTAVAMKCRALHGLARVRRNHWILCFKGLQHRPGDGGGEDQGRRRGGRGGREAEAGGPGRVPDGLAQVTFRVIF